jgi:copper chaperone NosL
MAISEKRFAAELILADETILKFDDIGCMLNYQKRNSNARNPTAVYVVDSETKKWIKAQDAFFGRPPNTKTPMGSGIVAYDSADKAGPGAVRYGDLTLK